MASPTTTTPPPASAPGAGTPDDGKKVAVGAVAAGFALGGPVGGVIMALAIGIEEAFNKSGWNQPGWAGGDKPPALTPEEIRQRHDDAVRRAGEYIAQAQAQAQLRRAAAAAHRQAMRDWIKGGRAGDKPVRPERRGTGDFLGDLWGMSKSGYTLFDDKMAKGNEKITGTYPAIGNFFRDLWNFVTGFAEGVHQGWAQYQQQKQAQQEQETQQGPEAVVTDDGAPPAQLDPAARPFPPNHPDHGPRPSAPPEPDSEPLQTEPQEPFQAEPQPEPEREPFWAGPATTPQPGELNSGSHGPGEGTVEGEPMTTEDATALPSGSAARRPGQPQGETNLHLLYQAFVPIEPVLMSIPEQVDALKLLNAAAADRLRRVTELCLVAGAPLVSRRMMLESRNLATVVASGLDEIETGCEVARELTHEALIGLVPAHDDLETTRSQQASGDLFNRVDH